MIIKKIYWWCKACLANLLYGFPSRRLFMIGVTGTDGKTTTTTMIYHILKTIGCKVDYISTVGANIAGKQSTIGFHVTTPRFFALQHYLRQAVSNRTQYFVLEVSSHALSQLRTAGIRFNIAVLTNITPDHLDYYKNFAEYAKTKLKLINRAKTAVVNVEAATYYRYKNYIRNKRLWKCALTKAADVTVRELTRYGLRQDFTQFEQEDAVLSYTVGRILGIPETKIVQALNSFVRVRGRFDYFVKKGRRFMIDFASAPYALEQLFRAIRQKFPHQRIIHIFGCAGLRDRAKRPKMGQISAQNANIIILTEEDYRTENLTEINEQIEQGIKKIKTHQRDQTYFMIPSRAEAIDFAVSLGNANDLIVLTGKGHEQSLARGKKEISWDEYQAIETALEKHRRVQND